MKSRTDLQNEFGVSAATVNNWIKLGLIPPPSADGTYKTGVFKEIIEALKQHPTKLKSRANRNRNPVKSIPTEMLQNKQSLKILQQLLSVHEKLKGTIEATVIALSIRFLELNDLIITANNKIVFLQKNSVKFETFLSNWSSKATMENVWKVYSNIKEFALPLHEIDFLGTLYQSLRSVSERSHSGAYYTPAPILSAIKINAGDKVLDPCCGTGRILIQVLARTHSPGLVYGADLDPLALNICRINLALFFKNTATESNLEVKDFIFPENNSKKTKAGGFDVVVTNPPWGAKMSREQKIILLKSYPGLKTTETFSIALYKAINLLSPQGRLHFVLPESFLSVAAHAGIRAYVFATSRQQHIRSYGNLFKGVLSKVIRLDLFKTSAPKETVSIQGLSQNKIPEGLLAGIYSRIPLLKNKLESAILLKIMQGSRTTLKGTCTYGLGIVSGNNSKHILPAALKNSEPVYSGKEIMPFYFKPPDKHLVFQAETFQQVAPVRLYRQEKICYRFISDKIVMALDTKGRLLLNSANFFIPETGLPKEILVLLFNASLTTFFYKRLFISSKVLKSHIENFPIPEFTKSDIKSLMDLYKQAINGADITKELNQAIGAMFGLNSREILYLDTL